MDLEYQAQVKKLVEENGTDDLVMIIGTPDVDGAELVAETVTNGDPSYAGPLAGVSLGLPVYHILEPEIKKEIPPDLYEKNLEMMAMVIDPEELEDKLKSYRSGESGS